MQLLSHKICISQFATNSLHRIFFQRPCQIQKTGLLRINVTNMVLWLTCLDANNASSQERMKLVLWHTWPQNIEHQWIKTLGWWTFLNLRIQFLIKNINLRTWLPPLPFGTMSEVLKVGITDKWSVLTSSARCKGKCDLE